MKMEGHIQSYLKVEVETLKRILNQSDKDLWLRMFLQEVDIWGKSHGMPDGIFGEGEAMIPMEEKKTREEKALIDDTNYCKECNCWACNRKGFLAGEGRKLCLCYNKDLSYPKGTIENQKRPVMSCRTFLEYEPDLSPNIAALPMKELFAKLKAHVAAEKAAKESKASFKTTPNPGRSDPNGRFSASSKLYVVSSKYRRRNTASAAPSVFYLLLVTCYLLLTTY